MQVSYNDGRREMLTGLTPEQVAEHAKRVTSDPRFESAEIVKNETDFMNRHERRKHAAQFKKKGK